MLACRGAVPVSWDAIARSDSTSVADLFAQFARAYLYSFVLMPESMRFDGREGPSSAGLQNGSVARCPNYVNCTPTFEDEIIYKNLLGSQAEIPFHQQQSHHPE